MHKKILKMRSLIQKLLDISDLPANRDGDAALLRNASKDVICEKQPDLKLT